MRRSGEDLPVADRVGRGRLVREVELGGPVAYASANYLVSGALVQAVSGMPYEDYLRQSVLDPLGMDTTVADADAAASVPDGHTFAFGQPVAIDAPFDPTGPSYGYLGGSAGDLAAFAAANLPGAEGWSPRIRWRSCRLRPRR